MRSDLPLTTRPPEHHPFFNTINTQTHRYHDGLSGERNKNKNVGFLSFSSSVSLLFFFFLFSLFPLLALSFWTFHLSRCILISRYSQWPLQ